MSEDIDLPDVLRRPAEAVSPGARAAALLGGADTGAYAGMTLGELVYDRVSIDPAALNAFEFVHKPAEGDVYRLATWAHATLGGGAGTVEGRINRLQGYVFERMAATALRQGGAVVSFPEQPNNPGWDFKVNGAEWQAKCGLSPSRIAEHFARHPDIGHVVVNGDLAAHFAHDDRVTALGGITRDLVRAHTDHGVHAAADMVELNLVRFAPALSVIRNGWALWKQETDWVSAASNIGVDSAARLAGAKAGIWLGHAIGGAAATALGGWPAVLAPVLGSAVGYRGGRALADFAKRRVLLRSEHTALESATCAWCTASARVLGVMVNQAAEAGFRFRRARERASEAWAPVVDDWLDRLEAEQAYRRLHQRRFERAAHEPGLLGEGGGALEAARAAMLAASRAGLLPSDVQAEQLQITKAAQAYAGGLKRRLLT